MSTITHGMRVQSNFWHKYTLTSINNQLCAISEGCDWSLSQGGFSREIQEHLFFRSLLLDT